MSLLYLISKLIKKLHLPAIKESKINNTSKICSGSHVVRTNIERYSYIGNFCIIINVTIGSFCSIADNCIIGGETHPIEWISTSPVFHKGKNILKKNFSNHEFETSVNTRIGNDVWIGNNCLIKSGVIINNGAIIGMGSVVTKDVGAYEIWAGNPAKIVRKRFDDDIVNKLLEVNWWDLDEETLKIKASNFNRIIDFLNDLEKI